MVHGKVVASFVRDKNATGRLGRSETDIVDTNAVLTIAHGSNVSQADGATRVPAGESLHVILGRVVAVFPRRDAQQVVVEVAGSAAHVGIRLSQGPLYTPHVSILRRWHLGS